MWMADELLRLAIASNLGVCVGRSMLMPPPSELTSKHEIPVLVEVSVYMFVCT